VKEETQCSIFAPHRCTSTPPSRIACSTIDRPKIVKALACLREAYNKVEEARELFAEAEAEKGERYRSVPPGSKDMDTEYFLKAGSRRWLVMTVEISAPKV
jgi:hypothetical protein